MPYFVYILECADKTLYCGYTTDLERRIFNHNNAKSGAKYTMGRRPVKLVYKEDFETLSEALKREHALKKLSKSTKAELISNYGTIKS